MRKNLRKAIGWMAVTLLTGGPLAHASSEVNSTPDASEMSASEWRRQQLIAADKSDKIMTQAEKISGLLGQYIFMQTKYDSNHDRAFQVIFGQYLSWFQTFIGDYDGAAASFSIAQPRQDDDGPSPLGAGYTLKPAADVIVEMAKTRRAVFFNEAHSAPITRTLTIELLPKLRELGYNYFAAETLYDTDHELQKRGYATPKSGFYVNEPLYGEMIHTALRLGFKVIPYDVENAGAGDLRERAGAERLYQEVFKKDPTAKLIVNAGFAHVQKTGKYLRGSSMGEFFKQISGIDPLTIEQTMMIQHGRSNQDHPYYAAIVQHLKLTQPSVFVAADGKPWTLKPDKYDMSVVFPTYQVIKQRPNWLVLNGERVAYSLGSEICRNQYPCLIEAFYSGEDDNAVAADRTLLNVIDSQSPANERLLNGIVQSESRLFLRPGSYHIKVTDKGNRAVGSRDITIGAAQ
ncbi:MAG TPA: hypothetical protein VH082_10835 [Rudaea sp.]|jgi:hypothetical protein|nr:hypothetical protein [Rudaea sp.]